MDYIWKFLEQHATPSIAIAAAVIMGTFYCISAIVDINKSIVQTKNIDLANEKLLEELTTLRNEVQEREKLIRELAALQEVDRVRDLARKRDRRTTIAVMALIAALASLGIAGLVRAGAQVNRELEKERTGHQRIEAIAMERLTRSTVALAKLEASLKKSKVSARAAVTELAQAHNWIPESTPLPRP